MQVLARAENKFPFVFHQSTWRSQILLLKLVTEVLLHPVFPSFFALSCPLFPFLCYHWWVSFLPTFLLSEGAFPLHVFFFLLPLSSHPSLWQFQVVLFWAALLLWGEGRMRNRVLSSAEAAPNTAQWHDFIFCLRHKVPANLCVIRGEKLFPIVQ